MLGNKLMAPDTGAVTVISADVIARNIDDRRQRQRYDIRMPVDVTGAMPSHRLLAGWSVDVSAAGIRIESEALARYQPFQAGETVAIAAGWPVLRNEITPLRLVIIGDIVRSTSRDLAVSIVRHYFEERNP